MVHFRRLLKLLHFRLVELISFFVLPHSDDGKVLALLIFTISIHLLPLHHSWKLEIPIMIQLGDHKHKKSASSISIAQGRRGYQTDQRLKMLLVDKA